MFGQINSVEMACNIRERLERGICTCEASQMAGEARAIHRASRCYFEKADSEKIDIETDVSDSE